MDRFRDERPIFPVLPPRDFSSKAITILEFKWMDGGRLAADTRLSSKLVGELLDIYAALVEFGSKRHTKFDSRIYRAIPTWFIDAANKSRSMEGYRLLKRMLRHSLDPKIAPLINTSAKLFQYEGELGILLRNAVPASMRGIHYPAEVAITKDKIIYCSCSCACGIESKSKCDGRIVCVHVLPVVYQLSLLLMDGLGENMLLEICARFSKEDSFETDFDQWSLFVLTKTALENNEFDKSMSNREMIEGFSVGTENRKHCSRSIPNPAFVGPVRNIQRMSVDQKATILMGQAEATRNEDKLTSPVYMFMSHFYTTLRDNGIEAVKRWTSKKNINIFKKRYVFIPIHGDLHWSLFLIVNPGNFGKDEEAFGLFHLDSLGLHNSEKIYKNISGWLKNEYFRIYPNNPQTQTLKYPKSFIFPKGM